MLFDDKGATLIGKPEEKLLKEYSRFETPPELSALIGEKNDSCCQDYANQKY